MTEPATIKTQAAIVACVLFLLLGAGAGYLLSGAGGRDAEPPAGATIGPGDGPDPGPFVFENPLRDAKVGEWAMYEQGGRSQFRFEVTDLDALTGAVRMVHENRDPELNRTLGRAEKRIGPNHFLFSHEGAGFVVTRVFPDRVVAAGRGWSCLCVEVHSPRSGTLRSWYCAEVPVLGLVRQVTVGGPHDGFVNAELIDWSGRIR